MGLFGRRVADMPTPEEEYYARRGAARAKKWAATTTGATEAAAERGRHAEATAKVSRWRRGR
ncbi:hypothetical protein ABT224_41450 [Streptomyces sp. NPDC001584]|uniref:hypothetical protein n=1 Tax=Streptomyces sp. NPDC001584 TaxID=3154521 RepID=UPI00331E7944